MPAKAIAYLLKNVNSEMRLQFQLIYQCAHFFKGLKHGCSLNLEPDLYQQLAGVLKDAGVSYILLHEQNTRCLVFLYRRDMLERYLLQAETEVFLRDCGYSLFGVDEVVEQLKRNLQQYFNGMGDFPHELGIMLGYPITDVRGFMENHGRKELLSGYWKVYSNPRQASMTFGMYDYARRYAVNELICGKQVHRIIR